MVEQTDCQARIPLAINLTLTESAIPYYPYRAGRISLSSIFKCYFFFLAKLSYLFVALSDSIHQVKGLESFPERAFFID